MRILISHTNYPSQFRRLIPELMSQGHEFVFVAANWEWHAPKPCEGLRLIRYETRRDKQPKDGHPWLHRFHTAIEEGQAVYEALGKLHESGWHPDWIINHVGFGNGLFLSDRFPNARRIGFFEWFYNADHSDVDFLAKGPVSSAIRQRLRVWNAQILLELASCDHAVTPTHWQRQQFPQSMQSRLTVIHEGIDIKRLEKVKQSAFKPSPALPDLSSCEVVTYVSRGFEEYRGFPQAMRCIELLQKQRPGLHAVLVGSDCTAYGPGRSDGRSWGEWAAQDLELDPSRTHWLGPLQEEEYHSVLAMSDVHLYLTVPFVLSWSLLEAMAAGCALVASDTPPVQEVLRHRRSALLVDFFDVQAHARAVESLLSCPQARFALQYEAQRAAQKFSCEIGHRRWMELLRVDTPTTVF